MSIHSPHLIVPGWGDSGPEHWQTHWQRDLHALRIEVADWCSPRPDLWISAIEAGVAALAGRDSQPPVLVAHSAGCIAIAHWARTARWPIRAALLVAPADVDHAESLASLRAHGPVPAEPLPFPSLVVTSDDDPCVDVERAEHFATAWQSELVVIRGGGHLNSASGLGRWRYGRALLAGLLQRRELARSA